MVMVNQNVLSGYNGEVSCGWDHELSSTADLSFTLKVMKESLKDFKQGSDRTRVCFNEHTVMGQRELGRDWVTAAMYQWICLSSTHLGLMQDSGPEQPWPGPQHLPLARSTARMLAAFFLMLQCIFEVYSCWYRDLLTAYIQPFCWVRLSLSAHCC